MKTKIFGGIAIAAIALVLALNVEALAADQIQIDLESEGTITCNEKPERPGNCWNFKWGNFNLSYTCYFSGYQKDRCYY